MNNIVETYLMFKANNVCEYINILALDIRKVSKVPKQLNKLIYKYYDLFVLSDKKIDYDLLKSKTGLEESYERLVLFYLLTEFDFASRTEFMNNELYNFYDFLVNSIIIFSNLELTRDISKDNFYDECLSRTIEKYNYLISQEYLFLLDRLHLSLENKFSFFLKKDIKFYENFMSNTYKTNYTKIINSNEYYIETFKYKNSKFANESKKDIELVKNEFATKLDFVNLEMISMRILKELLSETRRTIFVKLNDEVVSKKSNFDSLFNMFRLRFLKERIIFLVNTSLLDRYEERIKHLISNNFNISYIKNSRLTSYDVFKDGGYILINYDEFNESLDFIEKSNLEIIANKVDKKYIDNLKDIKYISV